jgi:hypothetical protein
MDGGVERVFSTLEKRHMQSSIDLPQAFSVRDENEFYPIQHLMSRLNPKLIVARVTTGRHIHGGPTVVWGLVYLDRHKPAKKDVELALKAAGYDLTQNGPVQTAILWGAE